MGPANMLIIRVIAVMFWTVCIMAFAWDAWLFIQTGALHTKSLGKWWAEIDGSSLTLTQNFIERYVSEGLWNPGLITILRMPASAVFAALGIILSWISRKSAFA